MGESATNEGTVKVVSPENFAGKKWTKFENFGFAAKTNSAPILVDEISSSAVSFPLGFTYINGVCRPVALLGLTEDENLFVSKSEQWIGRYIPAYFRAFPFMLIPNEEGIDTLCFDEASGLVSSGDLGDDFFDEKGEPTESIKQILTFLAHLQEGSKKTEIICKEIARAELLKPWEITINFNNSESEASSKKIDGLYSIDEEKLNTLGEKQLISLYQHSALPVIYAQLMSMQNLQFLENLIRERYASYDMTGNFSLDDIDSGSLVFDSLK
jgi:hypothetical protein